MLKSEIIERDDGVKLCKTYSDGNYKIKQFETGNIYDEAVDIENVLYTYEETDEKIDSEEIAPHNVENEEV